ncbi:hypothetical protein ABZY93_26105 [Streptomyces smyrnaeus]|uniref:hypothetical protein n=1 Tax=Streptomyces smyrnaeus TaxID=1387713 RepID=UPI0033B3C937
MSLSWKAHDDVERIIYDKSLRAERSRSTAAVMTGALASTLATLGCQVGAEFWGTLPAPALLVESGPKP